MACLGDIGREVSKAKKQKLSVVTFESQPRPRPVHSLPELKQPGFVDVYPGTTIEYTASLVRITGKPVVSLVQDAITLTGQRRDMMR